ALISQIHEHINQTKNLQVHFQHNFSFYSFLIFKPDNLRYFVKVHLLISFLNVFNWYSIFLIYISIIVYQIYIQIISNNKKKATNIPDKSVITVIEFYEPFLKTFKLLGKKANEIIDNVPIALCVCIMTTSILFLSIFFFWTKSIYLRESIIIILNLFLYLELKLNVVLLIVRVLQFSFFQCIRCVKQFLKLHIDCLMSNIHANFDIQRNNCTLFFFNKIIYLFEILQVFVDLLRVI
ncbi:hypothetical protein RFI_35208, partial [Reticulomyxa filosa]